MRNESNNVLNIFSILTLVIFIFQEHMHTPYLVIDYKFLEKWKAEVKAPGPFVIVLLK